MLIASLYSLSISLDVYASEYAPGRGQDGEFFFSLTIKLMELINGIVTLTLSDSLVPLKSAVSF